MSVPRLGRGAAFVVVAGLGAALLGVASAPWLDVPVATAIARETVSVRGTTAVPAVPASALLLLAAGLALALAGRLTRALALVAVAGAGLAAAVGAVMLLADPTPAALAAAAEATGVRALDGEPRTTAWPVLGAALGVGAVVAPGVLAWAARAWPEGGGRRYEPAAAGTAERTAGERSAGQPLAGQPAGEPAAQATDERVRAMDDWDALSRGEDPT